MSGAVGGVVEGDTVTGPHERDKDFNLDANLPKNERVAKNYGRSSNFTEYLKDITSAKALERLRLQVHHPPHGEIRLKEGSPAPMEEGPESDVGDDVDGPGGNESGELETVWQYLDNCYAYGEDAKIVEGKNPLDIVFAKDLFEPINAKELPELVGNWKGIVLIEFFTHCCINCIHSIEDIRQLYGEIMKSEEYRISDVEFKVISVHSPKFTREKDLESIKAFTEQLKMDEYSTVVNDPGCLLWNELEISCWPTILVLGPNPSRIHNGMNLLFTMMGEGHRHVLKLIITSAFPYFQHKFKSVEGSPQSRVLKPQVASKPSDEDKSALKYPGKVTSFQDMLVISDTGNHRIIISDRNGSVKDVIGGTGKGCKDGNFASAKFYYPQGVAFKTQDLLIVADTGNHAIRKIDLKARKVSTLVPPGWNYNLEDQIVHLRSPWDLTFFSQDILLIAAAGNHRIFAYFFESSKLFMSDYQKDSLVVVAGNGKEENRNNTYILKASFAQPSGICLLTRPDGTKDVYIADSESSSIRCISETGAKGKVAAVVGGAKDPTDLFSYGDVDGKGVAAKLQHPIGVCCNNLDGKVYIADTYNNKIKVIDPETQICSTLSGDGTPGDNNGEISQAKFNEPGGISFDADTGTLYVADTNNHAIKSINLQNKSVSKVSLSFPPSEKSNDTYAVFMAPFNTNVNFKVLISNIPNNFEGGQWRIMPSSKTGDASKSVSNSGEMKKSDSGIGEIAVTFSCENINQQFDLILDVFLCGPSACYKRTLKFLVKFDSNLNGQVDKKEICFTYEPKDDLFV